MLRVYRSSFCQLITLSATCYSAHCNFISLCAALRDELAVRIMEVVNSESVLCVQARWVLDQKMTAVLFHL